MPNLWRRVRTWTACATAAAAALSTTACGAGSLAPSRVRAEPPHTITMWTFKQTHVNALEQAAAVFKKQTGVTVRITAYTPDDTFSSKMQSGAATGNLADVVEAHAGGEDFTFGGAGIAADLASSMDPVWHAQFLPGTADSGLVTDSVYRSSQEPKSSDPGVKKGQLFSVPLTAGTFGIVYANRSMLKAAGLNPDQPPATWEQFISWLRATHTAGQQSGGITMGLQDPSTAFDWLLQPLSYAYLGKTRFEALFGKNPTSNWSSPAGQQLLSLYNELTPYWTPGSQALGIDDADRAFAQGKSAFDIGGTFTLSSIQQDGMNANNVVAFAVPPATGSAVPHLKLAPIALTGLSITASSANRADDLKWVRFLTSRQAAAAFARTALDLPATDLGASAASAVGPHMAALESVFGPAGPDTYIPSDTTFMGPTYDPTQSGTVLVQMSPLKGLSPAGAAKQLGVLITNSWK
ncbi:MAG: sugar binding protein of transporter system [Streptomyces oryziradicis]|jgi:multiple sugar transport system substrate-binding protein|nr:sugar binding protein of transporter system [Actinacidiphila oryziradicis]MDX6315353.1 multiple sugar transport system substrate-binding protein [Streptomyces sp.]